MVNQLPAGWQNCIFGDIASVRNGCAFKSKNFKKAKELNSDVPLVKQSQLVDNRVDLGSAVYLPYEFMEANPNYVLRKGDILIGMSGSIGKLCYYEHEFESLQNQRTGKVEIFAKNHLNSKFLGLYLSNIEQELIKRAKGMGIQNISGKDIEALPFLLPPLNEQKRIVAKIEQLFSELDNGIAALKTAREQLKVYRQAVLKHAFEGKLTAKWREENADKLETPEQLLARIQQERDARHQQQLENWKVAVKEWESLGKEGKSPPRPKQPKKLISHYTKDENLPDSWEVVPLEALISFGPTNGWSPKAVGEVTNTKAITLTATTSGKFDSSQFKYIDARIPKHSSLWLTRNDILVQRGNTIEYVGVPALYSGEDNKFIYPDLIMKIQTVDSIATQYVVHAMSMSRSRNFLRERAVGAAGSMPKINQQTLSSLPIYICSEPEQIKIVELLEEKLSLADSAIHEIDLQLSKAETLRQSILKRAFSGKLVPQDPSDEPASELLARIKAEKDQQKQSTKKSVTKRDHKKKRTKING